MGVSSSKALVDCNYSKGKSYYMNSFGGMYGSTFGGLSGFGLGTPALGAFGYGAYGHDFNDCDFDIGLGASSFGSFRGLSTGRQF